MTNAHNFSVMSGLGKDSVTTLLLTTPPYLIGTIIVLIAAWHADKTGERYLHIALPPILAIACFIIAVTTTSFAPRYVYATNLFLQLRIED